MKSLTVPVLLFFLPGIALAQPAAGDPATIVVTGAGRVVLGILARESGIAQDRGAQAIFGVQISAPHAFIDDILHRPAIIVQPALHAPFDEDVDDAGVLANRAMPLRAHAAVGQDLRNGVLGRRASLGLIGFAECADIIHRVIVTDELERVGHALDQIGGFDERHLTLVPISAARPCTAGSCLRWGYTHPRSQVQCRQTGT